MTLKTRFRLVCLRLEDGIRYSRCVRGLLACLFWWLGGMIRRTDSKIRHFTKALGLAEMPGTCRRNMRSLEPLLNPICETKIARVYTGTRAS